MSIAVKEVSLQGTLVSGGIAIGKPFFFSVTETEVSELIIDERDIGCELVRYRKALNTSRKQVKTLHRQLEGEGATEGAAIMDAHYHIMKDPLLVDRVEDGIKETRKNAESVLYTVINQCEVQFRKSGDPVFCERIKDLHDIFRRISQALYDCKSLSLADVPRNSIIFAKELVPSDTAGANKSSVGAFVTESGGLTSHAAIVARAKGIPYITGINVEDIEKHSPSCMIIDGRTGSVIINPTLETLDKYHQLKKRMKTHYKSLEKAVTLETKTFDGHQIILSANIDMANELDQVHRYGGNGVGLYRSEYIFLAKDNFPDEQEQFLIYKRLAKKMNGLPLVIRTFDVGGDKFCSNDQISHEKHSFLGYRAIRFMLKEKKIFKTQLRAILRASAFGNIRIMFPMISGLPELIEAKKLLKEARKELLDEKKKVAKGMKVGCMIEVPSAAVISDLIAQECDFLSIGTNDLVQYALAIDRGFQEPSPTFSPMHPSVIRLVKLVIAQAASSGVPVTVCGEAASDPRLIPLYVGLGVHELSVASRYLPLVKNVIRSISYVEATHLADNVLKLKTAFDVKDFLEKEYQKYMPDESLYTI